MALTAQWPHQGSTRGSMDGGLKTWALVPLAWPGPDYSHVRAMPAATTSGRVMSVLQPLPTSSSATHSHAAVHTAQRGH